MGLDDIITSGAGAAARSARPQQDAETDEKKKDVNVFGDIAASPFRGVEGAIQGIYDLADYATGDELLPNYDTRFLGRSGTFVGGLGEGIANFLTGFVPVAGWLGKAGQVTKAGRVLGKGTAGLLARGKTLDRTALRALSKKKDKALTAARYVAAGAVADFAVFDGQEERLSNLLYQFPALQNPVTEFLKEDDDEELEGRFKNVIEGLFIEAGVAGLIAPFIKGVKTLKARGKAATRGLDKVDATEEAIAGSKLSDTDFDLAVEQTGVKGDEDGKVSLTDEDPTKPAPLGEDTKTTDPTEASAVDEPLGAGDKKSETVSSEEVERRVQEFKGSLAKMDPEGGEQAILSAARTVRSDADFSVLVESAARWRHENAVAQGTVTKVTADELLAAGREIGDILGSGDKNALEAAVRKAERDAEDLSLIMGRQNEIKRLNNVIAKEAHEKAKQALKADEDASAGDYDVLAAEAFESMNLLLASQKAWSLFGHNLGLALKQRDVSYTSLGQKTKDLKTSRASLAAFRDESAGSMSEKKLLKLMAMSNDESSMVAAINRHVAKTKGSKLFNMVREYWVNSLLSGPATQIVNLLGSMLTYSIRSAERAVGAVATGEFELARATIQYSFNIESITDAFKLAHQAIKSGDAVTLQNARTFDDVRHSRKAIESESDNAFGTALNFIGTTVRLPTRGLLAGDELFKALSYRTYIKTELAARGMKKGYRGNALGDYVKSGMDAYITEGGRAFNEVNLVIDANRQADIKKVSFEKRDKFIEDYMERVNPEVYKIDDGAGKVINLSREDRGALAERASLWAKENTHTQDSSSNIVRNLSFVVAQNPLLTFVIPFVRTPTNLLSFGFARSPLAMPMEGLKLISKDYRQKFFSGTAAEKADIRGRLATGVASTATLLWLMESTEASKFITGYGPREKTQRKAWEMNNQQYSLKVGDNWVAYNRADPAATMLGLIADFVEARRSGEFDDDAASDLFGAMALSLANNITNKSYVQGLDNLFNMMKDPPKNTQRFIGSIAGGFVPNLANQAMSFEEDRALRETRNLMDYLIKRTPFSGKIPPRRNFLGEVETMSSSGGLGGVLNPLYTKEILDDPVNSEFANLGQGFGKPGFYLRDGVKSLDMREAVKEDGQDAYDRMLELMSTTKIGGKTLRGRLGGLFNMKAYQRLPDVNLKDETGSESPKVSSIRKLIRAYRTKARYEMLKEFPELKQKHRQVLIAARNQRQ